MWVADTRTASFALCRLPLPAFLLLQLRAGPSCPRGAQRSGGLYRQHECQNSPSRERSGGGGLPSLASPRDERRTPSGTALPQRLSRVPTVTSVNALGDGAQKRHRRLQRGAPTPAVGGGAGLQEGSVPVP